MTESNQGTSKPQQSGGVAELSQYRELAVSRQRVRRIRDWHALQHMRDDIEPAALICVTLSADGQIQSTALGLEPEARGHLAEELVRIARAIHPMIQAA
jgi:hypothetical protein